MAELPQRRIDDFEQRNRGAFAIEKLREFACQLVRLGQPGAQARRRRMRPVKRKIGPAGARPRLCYIVHGTVLRHALRISLIIPRSPAWILYDPSTPRPDRRPGSCCARVLQPGSGSLSQPRVFQAAAGGDRNLARGAADEGGANLLSRLRRGHRPVSARRGGDDAGRRRRFRFALGHDPGVLRVHGRRHAGLPRLPFPPARLGAAALRRAAARRSMPASNAKAASTCSPCAWCRFFRSS